MDTLKYLLNKFNFDPEQRRLPVEIFGVGRVGLAGLFNELGFFSGAEIGVERGLYSEVLCQANPQAKLYSIDPWQAYRGYRDHVSQDKLEGFYQAAVERLSKYNCEIVRKFSAAALADFPDNSLDFVYIDGNHRFEEVAFDIAHWSKKVRPGGMVTGHDYIRHKNQCYSHVVEVVQGYTYAYRIRPWFVFREEKGAASWGWVKG